MPSKAVKVLFPLSLFVLAILVGLGYLGFWAIGLFVILVVINIFYLSTFFELFTNERIALAVLAPIVMFMSGALLTGGAISSLHGQNGNPFLFFLGLIAFVFAIALYIVAYDGGFDENLS